MFQRALATGEFGEDTRFTAKIMLNYPRLLTASFDTLDRGQPRG